MGADLFFIYILTYIKRARSCGHYEKDGDNKDCEIETE